MDQRNIRRSRQVILLQIVLQNIVVDRREHESDVFRVCNSLLLRRVNHCALEENQFDRINISIRINLIIRLHAKMIFRMKHRQTAN